MDNTKRNTELLWQLLREPDLKYRLDTQLPLFAEDQLLKGHLFPLSEGEDNSTKPKLFYQHPHGSLFVGDSIHWLSSLESGSFDDRRA